MEGQRSVLWLPSTRTTFRRQRIILGWRSRIRALCVSRVVGICSARCGDRRAVKAAFGSVTCRSRTGKTQPKPNGICSNSAKITTARRRFFF